MGRVYLLLVGVAVGLLAAGCSSGKLQTRGRVLKGGQPYIPPAGEYVRLTFVPILEQGTPKEFYVAEFNRADATFRVAGKDLKGMPPGKYKIVVEHLRNRADIFKGEFDAKRTPFTCEVRSGADEVTIDLANKGDKKGTAIR